jgi:hypothetical protein
MLHRKPAKQYYRGLHKDNTALSCYLGDGSLTGLVWNLHTLQEFVDKPCYQSANMLDPSEGTSWALNKHMAVTAVGRIMVLNLTVGIANFEEKTIKVIKPLFNQEIKEAFPFWKL